MAEFTFQLLDKKLICSHRVPNSFNYKVRCIVTESKNGNIIELVVDSVQNENGIFPTSQHLNQINEKKIKNVVLIKLKEYIHSLGEDVFN